LFDENGKAHGHKDDYINITGFNLNGVLFVRAVAGEHLCQYNKLLNESK